MRTSVGEQVINVTCFADRLAKLIVVQCMHCHRKQCQWYEGWEGSAQAGRAEQDARLGVMKSA